VVDNIFLDLTLPDSDNKELISDVKKIMINHIVIGGPNQYMCIESMAVAGEITNLSNKITQHWLLLIIFYLLCILIV
jgi:hypothetical protein